MDSLPLVSAIIPVHNGERYLGEAIESALAQSYQPLEIILVDDGSTDSSGDVARRYAGVRCIRQQNLGVSVARNAGVAASRGELIAFLDADDMWTRDKLAVQVAYMLAHPEVGFAFTRQRFVFEPGVEAPGWFRPDLLAQDHAGFAAGMLMVRREVFERVGGFDPRLRRGEDTDWLLRARDLGFGMGMVPETLLLRRVHSGNVSLMKPPDYGLFLSLLKRSIDRRKGMQGE